jgi:hypothetical protein
MKQALLRTLVLGLAALALTLTASPLRAQETSPARGATAARSHEAHGEEHGEEHEHANELGVFVGGTSENDETHFTIGVEYERRLSRRLGIGVIAEHVDGVDAWVFLAPLSFQPSGHLGLTFYAGPGFESKVPELEHTAGHSSEGVPSSAAASRSSSSVPAPAGRSSWGASGSIPRSRSTSSASTKRGRRRSSSASQWASASNASPTVEGRSRGGSALNSPNKQSVGRPVLPGARPRPGSRLPLFAGPVPARTSSRPGRTSLDSVRG